MALRGTLNHRKTRRLGRTLGIPPCYALGIMEGLWHVTAALFPTGAIGRMSDEEIADQLGFPTDGAPKLVAALLDAELVDASRQHRLIVHDWHHHSDNTLDAALYRKGLYYANGSMPRGTKLDQKMKAALFEQFYKRPPTDLFAQQQDDDRAEAEAPEMPANVLQFVPAPNGAAKRLPEPEPVPVPEPVTPLPPAVRRGSGRSIRRAVGQALATPGGEHLQRASQRVLTALRVTGTYGLRAQVAIVMAIDAECKRVDKPPETAAPEIAERMVSSWAEYLRNEHLLRFKWQPPKFFEGGHWADDRTWPWDQQLIAQQRNASIGMR